MTDRALIDGLSQGTQEAANYLYERFRPGILRSLVEKGLDRQAAENIFQMAVLSELRRRKETPLTLVSASYRTYFNTICNNLYLNHCRENRRRATVTPEELTLPGEEDTIERALESIVFQKIIDDALQALSDLCREILDYTLFTDDPLDQIAVVLGITHDAARQRASRCRRRLRNIISDDPRWREMKE